MHSVQNSTQISSSCHQQDSYKNLQPHLGHAVQGCGAPIHTPTHIDAPSPHTHPRGPACSAATWCCTWMAKAGLTTFKEMRTQQSRWRMGNMWLCEFLFYGTLTGFGCITVPHKFPLSPCGVLIESMETPQGLCDDCDKFGKIYLVSRDYILIIYDMVITRHQISVQIQLWQW